MPKYSADMGDPIDMLAEEMIEVLKEIMKARRFGMDGMPEWVAAGNLPPRRNIENEIGDVLAVLEILCTTGTLSQRKIDEAIYRKKQRLAELFGH